MRAEYLEESQLGVALGLVLLVLLVTLALAITWNARGSHPNRALATPADTYIMADTSNDRVYTSS